MVLGLLLVGYGATYCYLSRRGVHEAVEYGLDGFLYVPAEEVFATESLGSHERSTNFFAPANWIDRKVFGGPKPVGCILFHLS